MLSRFLYLEIAPVMRHVPFLWSALAGLCHNSSAPEHPVLGITNSVAGIPELRGDAAVTRILQHTAFFAILDFPRNFGRELKLKAMVVDGPGAVGLHKNSIVGIRDQILKFQAPGKRLTLVMRIIGSRFQPSVRTVPPERCKPIRCAVSRLER